MNKYMNLMNRVYGISFQVLNHLGSHKDYKNWHFTDLSVPRNLSNGQCGSEIVLIQFKANGDNSSDDIGIEAVAARDCNGVDYFCIGASFDDPVSLNFNASDIEIAATIGWCAKLVEDYN